MRHRGAGRRREGRRTTGRAALAVRGQEGGAQGVLGTPPVTTLARVGRRIDRRDPSRGGHVDEALGGDEQQRAQRLGEGQLLLHLRQGHAAAHELVVGVGAAGDGDDLELEVAGEIADGGDLEAHRLGDPLGDRLEDGLHVGAGVDAAHDRVDRPQVAHVGTNRTHVTSRGRLSEREVWQVERRSVAQQQSRRRSPCGRRSRRPWSGR